MGRPITLRKGSWTEEEDTLLRKYVENYGEGNWKHIPTKAGLNRCRKSCRLRWLNYLRPNIKRGDFAVDEDDLIIRLHRLLGNRWSLIAGRIPGRTANDIKNYWNSCLSKKIASNHSKSRSNLETNPCNDCSDSAMNSEPLKGEEEQDTTSFWRSLLLEGDYLETKLIVETKEMKVSQVDDLFQGLEDLCQDLDILGGSG